jgi:RNA polymerase sigma factor (sigma-70 family)
MEWTSQAVRGSTGAFARVYERHERALYRYCRSLLGDDEEARDALQSTMTKAFAALRFEERDFELRPWLFRIAHNESVSRLRQRREAVELDVGVSVATDSLVQMVEDRERLAQLRADLRELPERQRAALVMRELNGLGHAEIAAVLGGSPQTVKQTIFAARTALHECDEGRAMRCAEVQRVLSDGDGRTLRSRRMRAHVRSCRSCREFEAALAVRPRDLAALAPAPPTMVGTWLARVLAGGSGASGGTVAAKVAVVMVAAATVAGTTTAVPHAAHPRSRPAHGHAAAAARQRVAPRSGDRGGLPVLAARGAVGAPARNAVPATVAPGSRAPARVHSSPPVDAPAARQQTAEVPSAEHASDGGGEAALAGHSQAPHASSGGGGKAAGAGQGQAPHASSDGGGDAARAGHGHAPHASSDGGGEAAGAGQGQAPHASSDGGGDAARAGHGHAPHASSDGGGEAAGAGHGHAPHASSGGGGKAARAGHGQAPRASSGRGKPAPRTRDPHATREPQAEPPKATGSSGDDKAPSTPGGADAKPAPKAHGRGPTEQAPNVHAPGARPAPDAQAAAPAAPATVPAAAPADNAQAHGPPADPGASGRAHDRK